MPRSGNGDDHGPEVGIAATLPISSDSEVLGVGASVGRYIIEDMVGRGGFALVYRGRHIRGDQPVAIKVLHSKLAFSDTVFKRFQREAATTQKLEHPAIVRHIDWGQLTDGRPYMIMEWLEGETLGALMERRGAMDVAEMLPLVRALCEPLAEIHAQSIVHRDLKPSNVMVLDPDAPRLKLLDFGMVRLVDAPGQRLTSTGAPLGTPGYMAPEQILGEEVSPAVDVYALGVILYEMLTGKLPFRAQSAVEVQELHLSAMPPRVSDEAPVPGTIDDLIRRCLDKDPRRRPSPVMEVHDLLASAVAHPGRATDRFASGEADAVGVYLRGSPEALRAARDKAIEAELAVAMEEDGELLCVLPPRDGIDARAHVIDLSRRLASDDLVIQVHEAGATLLSILGASQITGGPLLEIETWPGAPPAPGVYVSDTLAGAVDDSALEAVEGHEHVYRLRIR